MEIGENRGDMEIGENRGYGNRGENGLQYTDKLLSESGYIKSNLDCNFTFPIGWA